MTPMTEANDDSNGLFLDLCSPDPDGALTVVYRLGDRDVVKAPLKTLVEAFVKDCLSLDSEVALEDRPLLGLMAGELEELAGHLRALK